MKRARIASRLLASAPRAARISRTTHQLPLCTRRHASTTTEQDGASSRSDIYDQISGDAAQAQSARQVPLPSPPPHKARSSAKLAALHARLSLSPKIPVETLARALVDPSADAHLKYNNTNLAYIGATLLNNHASEHLITRYPRLPMAILFAAMKGYVGPAVLHQVARAWGVETAAAPGEEVDPGLLQFDSQQPTALMTRWGYVRAESAEIERYKWRRGMSSRVLYDDAFGEMVPGQKAVTDGGNDFMAHSDRNTKEMTVQDFPQNAHANFVRALVGAVYLHCGRDAAKNFVKSHFLMRKLDLANLFEFKLPTRELARLCAREDFEPPVARLESETGRLSRTPVYVVGIYSGNDKLGEGAGSDLDSARVAAAINALKAWYLYSPGDVGVPSDMLAEDAEPWKPAHVDIGEIIS